MPVAAAVWSVGVVGELSTVDELNELVLRPQYNQRY
jgi:hypothetical protein